MVNMTLAMGHQSRPGALLKISNSHMVCSTPNEHMTILLFWLGKTIPPSSIPGDTISRTFVVGYSFKIKIYNVEVAILIFSADTDQ